VGVAGNMCDPIRQVTPRIYEIEFHEELNAL